MISRTLRNPDIVLLTAEYWDDHPLSPAGVIARVLEASGFSVGIIEKPESDKDFLSLGRPKLCFCVTAGSIDSMLNNYTPLKKRRAADIHAKTTRMPDRAIIVYCNSLKRLFKGCQLVIGGIEASLRRFAHYDYWDNALRKSILLDSRADILVYGNGEKQVVQIAKKMRNKEKLDGIPGTCVLRKELPASFEVLPPFREVLADKKRFCQMQVMFSNNKNLAQEYDNNFVLQYKYPEYETDDLDWLYSLPFTRKMHLDSLLKMAQFSVVTHRGCIGQCNFCSITLHQGDRIISRSEDNILEEIRKLTKHPEFKGYVDDLGGPSANMYGMDCRRCGKDCLDCDTLDRSHSRLIAMMRKARQIPGVKKVFVRSGIRYDLAIDSEEYVRELASHHISGSLKIAPEHFSEEVLGLMNKPGKRFDEFVLLFNSVNKNKNQALKYYLMLCHPGDDEKKVKALIKKASQLGNVEQFQVFTPTPMSISSCMYWTGMNPFTMEKIKVIYDYKTKKKLKTLVMRGLVEKHDEDYQKKHTQTKGEGRAGSGARPKQYSTKARKL